jgi:hypothetical protein
MAGDNQDPNQKWEEKESVTLEELAMIFDTTKFPNKDEVTTLFEYQAGNHAMSFRLGHN